jgi:hypothetical protein
VSITYTMRAGGGVQIQESYIVHERRMLNDNEMRRYIRERLRTKILANLAEKSGLPFDLAITNITSWKEIEATHREWENFKYEAELQPVVLLTTCYVRRVEYPEEAK